MKTLQVLTNRRSPSRGASILVCVLVCLAIVMALVASSVQSALQTRRAMRTQHQVRQTEWLLAAGIQRAAGQLRADSQYDGETWELSPQTLPGMETAQVTIEIAPSEGNASPRVCITARISASEHAAVQRSYSFSMVSQQTSEKE